MSFRRKDVQNCIACGQGIGNNWMNPTFYRVNLECFILNMRAIHSQAGLEQYFGGGNAGAVLADVMGPDPELATSPGKAIKTFLVCGECAGVGADEDIPDPERPPMFIDQMKSKVWDSEDGETEDQAR